MLVEFTADEVAVLHSYNLPVNEGVAEISVEVARDWLQVLRKARLPSVRPHWRDKLEIAAMQSTVDSLRRDVRDLRAKNAKLDRENTRLKESETFLKDRNTRLAELLKAMEAGYSPPRVVGDLEVNAATLETVVKMLGGITRSELAQEIQKARDTEASWDDAEEPGY